MLLGFFKKIVLADNLALIVQPVYASPEQYSGASALVATLAFAFQIFFDFSAYTDIARGASRVMGIELTRNFLRPYFATSIPEFWHRWHISLSTWFRDYLYIPLGGNRVAKWRWFFNLWVVFVLCGFWHGANWTFLVWGALHGLYICLTHLLAPGVIFLKERTAFARNPRAFKLLSVLLTFSMVCWAWVMFRAETLAQGLAIWKSLAGIPIEVVVYVTQLVIDRVSFSPLAASGLTWLVFPSGKLSLMPAYLLLLTCAYFYLAYRYRSCDDGEGFAAAPKAFRWATYFSALTGIVLLGNFGAAQFIYFQF
jgi:D-alanyl-lipoteichoic acid acyltransferase DltB (MBOAT superfamily)